MKSLRESLRTVNEALSGDWYFWWNHFEPETFNIVMGLDKEQSRKCEQYLDSRSSDWYWGKLDKKCTKGVVFVTWDDEDCNIFSWNCNNLNAAKSIFIKAYNDMLKKDGISEGQEVDDIVSEGERHNIDALGFIPMYRVVNWQINKIPTAEEAWDNYIKYIDRSYVDGDSEWERDVVDMNTKKILAGPGNITFWTPDEWWDRYVE